jgi:transcriptional regulator with XRE-family HTH domain
MLRTLLDLATPTLRDVARAAGISYHAIRQYRLGERTPSPPVRRAIVAAVRRQAGRLAKSADAVKTGGSPLAAMHGSPQTP